MTITSSFFNSVGGDRVYNASNFAEYFASFIGNGVFPNPSNNLQVTAVAGPVISVQVNSGRGWIRGYYVNNDQSFQLFLPNADGVLNRIDRIVLALDLNLREINIYAKSGTPANNPLPPNLTRNASTYELALADVRVNSSTTSISQSAITDLRGDNTLCGFVTGTVDQVDTTTLFRQYQDRFMQQSAQFQLDAQQQLDQERVLFEDWFANLQDTLSGDVAGNLQNEINALNNTVNNLDSNLQSQIESLNSDVVKKTDQAEWFSPTLMNGNTAGPFAIRYSASTSNIVYIEGEINVADVNLFTLPVGFRPSMTHRGSGIQISNGNHITFTVFTNGTVTIGTQAVGQRVFFNAIFRK